ncbi:MAG: DUF3737 family protein [Clostridiales bacterium]|nr:DUF3737 family protein [Clostridiales bacterium]
MSKDLKICEGTFADGESPLKESSNLLLENCLFKWKYPLWYCKDVKVTGSTFFDTARAGVWYTENITFRDGVIEAPKTFRRAKGITLERVTLPNAAETLWNCEDITLKSVTANGTYFAMNCQNVVCEDFVLTGDYCFDGAQNVTIKNAKILSKDSFWNSKNVTVYDSFITGEYLGWNAENLTLVGCTIESLQGLCYIKNLKLVNCRLVNTTLAFEYSTVDAQISGAVDSVLNPSGGQITADRIGTLIIEPDKVDPEKTVIRCTEAE